MYTHPKPTKVRRDRKGLAAPEVSISFPRPVADLLDRHGVEWLTIVIDDEGIRLVLPIDEVPEPDIPTPLWLEGREPQEESEDCPDEERIERTTRTVIERGRSRR